VTSGAGPGAGTVKLDFVAILDTAVVAVSPSGSYFPVQIADAYGAFVAIDTFGGVKSLNTNQRNANLAPWQSPWASITING
jgi:hypothetical protein